MYCLLVAYSQQRHHKFGLVFFVIIYIVSLCRVYTFQSDIKFLLQQISENDRRNNWINKIHLHKHSSTICWNYLVRRDMKYINTKHTVPRMRCWLIASINSFGNVTLVILDGVWSVGCTARQLNQHLSRVAAAGTPHRMCGRIRCLTDVSLTDTM